MGMKQILVMMAAVVLVGCGEDTRKAAPKKAPSAEEIAVSIADPIVEKAIRKSLKKPEGNSPRRIWKKLQRLTCTTPKSPTRASRKWPSCKSLKSLT